MTTATKQIITISLEKGIDLRTAAFVDAINKLHLHFQVTGIN